MKRDCLILGCVIVFGILAIQGSLLSFSSSEAFFYMNSVDYDKVFLFFIIPAHIFGIAWIDKYILYPLVIRIGNRRKSMLISCVWKWCFTFLFLCIWYSFLILLPTIKFPIRETPLFQIVENFPRYFMALLISANLATIFKHSKVPAVSSMAHFIAVLIPLIEMNGIRRALTLSGYGLHKFGFLYSWVYIKGNQVYPALLVIFALTIVYLFRISAKRDML